MQIHFTGHGIEITDALKTFTEEKFEKIKRFEKISTPHIVFKVEKLEQTVEATLIIEGTTIHAHATDTDMYCAIDALMDKLHRQLIKYKEKHDQFKRDHH